METQKKIIDESIDVAKGFLQKLINPPIEELGLLVSDNIRLWRFKNQIRILEKAKKIVDKKKIKIQEIPLKILVPMLDGASLEEDDDLRDNWSALIANSVDKNKDVCNPIFSNILKQLSSNEARCIKKMIEKKSYSVFDFYDLWNEFELNWTNVYNLKRLGLLETERDIYISGPGEYDEDEVWNQDIHVEGDKEYKLTPLGIEFIKAVNE